MFVTGQTSTTPTTTPLLSVWLHIKGIKTRQCNMNTFPSDTVLKLSPLSRTQRGIQNAVKKRVLLTVRPLLQS